MGTGVLRRLGSETVPSEQEVQAGRCTRGMSHILRGLNACIECDSILQIILVLSFCGAW